MTRTQTYYDGGLGVVLGGGGILYGLPRHIKSSRCIFSKAATFSIAAPFFDYLLNFCEKNSFVIDWERYLENGLCSIMS